MKEAPHICVLIRSLANGGAEKQSLLLAKALKDQYETHLIVLDKQPMHPKHIETIDAAEISCMVLDGNLISKMMTVVRFLKERNISYIFSYLPSDTLFAAIAGKLSGVKHIYGGIRNARMPRFKREILKHLHNRTLKGSIANCHSGADHFISHGFRHDKMLVMPNGIEVNGFSSGSNSSSEAEVQILSVGRFVEQKDYETALKAISILQDKLKPSVPFRYSIIGYGKLERQIESWIRQYGLGEIVELYIDPPNIHEHFANADIYLSTSIFEGLSNTIMEAMGYGIPVVATRAGDNEFLVQDQSNGFLTEIKDAESLAEGLNQLIGDEDLRTRFGKESYDLIKDNYSYEAFQKNYYSLIEKNSHEVA